MNIFYLHNDPIICAQMHNDKHCVKMVVEYAQLLSTAHRVLDGEQYSDIQNGRRIQRWKLNDLRDPVLYKASHIKHPSQLWVQQSDSNYFFLYRLFCELSHEYTYRYQRVHKTYTELIGLLSYKPDNIRVGPFTQPTPAMPNQYKIENDSIQSYRNYYNGEKDFSTWNFRSVPPWYGKIMLAA